MFSLIAKISSKNVIKKRNCPVSCGQCNVERAYYEGFVIKQSNLEAERWFLEAARDHKPTGSIKAQTVLGLFYSRPGEDSFDLQKVG